MAKLKAEKKAIGEKLAVSFDKATAAIIAEYRGMTADELATLRRDLRNADSEFKVVKNRVAIKAITGKAKSEDLTKKLKGPVGVVYLYGDVASGTKSLFNYAKTNKNLVITGGVLDGKLYSAADFESISELPSREVLMGRLLGTLVAPHQRLLRVINGVSENLVRAISAIKDQKTS